MGVLRDKIRAATDRRQVGRPVSAVVADLNPVLRGWAAYFRNGNSAGKFSTIDSYVHERLAIFDNRKRGIPGRRWGKRHDGAWFTRPECSACLETCAGWRCMPAGERCR
jgi:RNA-directed DNA polymerase